MTQELDDTLISTAAEPPKPEQVYKYKIDQEALTQFFLSSEEPTPYQIKEINKCITIIMIKYYNKYYRQFEELKHVGLLAVLERRKQYDPTYKAYSYIYTILRNEIGNKINKYNKEGFLEDILNYKEKVYETHEAELPPEVAKYRDLLTGETPFTHKRIPKSDVLPLLLFLHKFESRKATVIPSYLENDPKALQWVYKTLKDFIENDEEFDRTDSGDTGSYGDDAGEHDPESEA